MRFFFIFIGFNLCISLIVKFLFKKVHPIDSTILNNMEEFKNLIKLCEFPKSTKLKLIYRATRDGFSSQNFYSKCNTIGKTLTVIKTTNADVFGAFIKNLWNHMFSNYVYDDQAFIFSLINSKKTPIKMKCVSPQHAFYCKLAYGPTFGGNYDLHISDNSNINLNSYSNLGNSYKHPLYANGSIEAKNFLAGTYNFKTVEIEVFSQES